MSLSAESVVPQPGWIFVQRKLPAKTTAGGLHIPDTVRTKNRGITPGESQSVTVIAVSPVDAADSYLATLLPEPGDTVFVLALADNLVPVWDSDWGLVERENGFAVPEYYLFKRTAVAAVVREIAP
jgi:co-chaperonin GroES (HSP10)